MKLLLAVSLACGFASLLGLAALSAMSVVPAAETERSRMLLAVAIFTVGWLGLAIWAWRRMRSAPKAARLPSWLRATIVAAGSLYVLLALIFSLG